MQLAGYQQWIEVFDEDISKIWQVERGELQKAGMLFRALERELKNVRVKIEKDISSLREQLEEKDALNVKRQLSFSPKHRKLTSLASANKENQPKSRESSSAEHMSETESPDLFRNINMLPFRDTVVVDLSLSEEEKNKTDDDVTNVETSPTISRKFKKMSRWPNKSKETKSNIKENIFKQHVFQKDSDYDTSVIDCTPEIDRIKTDINRSKLCSSKRRPKAAKTATLTQMVSTGFKRKVKPLENKVALDNDNSDERYYVENSDEEPMQITDLLNYINEHEPMDTDCSQKVEPHVGNTSNKKPKMIAVVEPESVVRGKARKQLTGFSCDKCIKFYGSKKLSAQELQKKINECSKHRYKYRPPEDTMPGFWDLSFDPPNN